MPGDTEQLQLIDSLRNPATYPHPVTEIQVIETHISWLILTGDYAYKIKKPVDFGFLDFTTLEKREYFCREELRLNQRLAPDIYMEVLSIGGTPELPELGAENGIFEYAVKMHQFNPRDRLDLLLAHKHFDPDWIDRLAEQIADFHQHIPIIAQDSPLGETDTIWDVVSENFLHITETLDSLDDCQRVQHLLQYTAQQFRQLTPLLKQRKQEGHIRECHGDLHLANITLYQGELRLFDCIEFNPRFSWIDPISDLAFLLMDLEANGEFSMANRCLNHYLEITGDYQGLALLNFYKAYRAMVRAKVAVLGSEPDLTTMRRYLSLTERYARKNELNLFLMHGVSGSGKSHLSHALITHSSIIRLRSDVERKRLFSEISKQGEMIELYGPQMNMLTENHLLDTSRALLQNGFSVVVDATFIRASSRRDFRQMAKKLAASFNIIACDCDQKTLESRLQTRQEAGTDISDADIAVMQQQLVHLQPLDEKEEADTLHIDTRTEEPIRQLLTRLQPHERFG